MDPHWSNNALSTRINSRKYRSKTGLIYGENKYYISFIYITEYKCLMLDKFGTMMIFFLSKSGIVPFHPSAGLFTFIPETNDVV